MFDIMMRFIAAVPRSLSMRASAVDQLTIYVLHNDMRFIAAVTRSLSMRASAVDQLTIYG